MPSKRDLIQQMRQTTFTGRQAELALFNALLPLNRPSQTCVLMIYGIGGIGKTALLDQFMRDAQAVNVWTARLDPRVQASIFDFLLAIYNQLRGQDRVHFPQFEEGLERHHAIENKLLGRNDIPRTALQMFVRGAHAALKGVPVLGEVAAEMVSPEQITAAISQIYGAVGRGEGDFWMKPEDELTDRLVTDLNAYAVKHRILLMFDNYEWIGDFDNWVRDRLFDQLESHVLLVLGGRRRLGGKGWSEFNALMQQVELKPLSAAESREYLQKKGITDTQAVATMTDYADGHPLVLAMLTDLAEHAGGSVQDLAQMPERKQIVRSLLDRIKQNMAANLSEGLEMCAILRSVNEDSLAYMLGQPHIGPIFDAISRFDFVKLRVDGFALHQSVWDALNEELAWRNPTRYRELQAKAAEYYERALVQPNSKDRKRWELERLYHRIRADEAAGIKLFQEQAEELVRYRLVNALRLLLDESNNYKLEEENSRLWLRYYKGRLDYLENHLTEAGKTYQMVSENPESESRLRAYALCDLAEIWIRPERMRQEGGADRALRTLERSRKLVPDMDSKLISIFMHLRFLYSWKGDWQKALEALEQQRQFFLQQSDDYGPVSVLSSLADAYGIIGDWKKAFENMGQALQKLDKMPGVQFHRFPWYHLAWSGHYIEAEHVVDDTVTFAQQASDLSALGRLFKDWGYVFGLQGKYAEANRYFDESLRRYAERGSEWTAGIGVCRGFWGATLLRAGDLDGAKEQLTQGLSIKMKVQDEMGLPEIYNLLAELYEIKAKHAQDNDALLIALSDYNSSLSYHWVGRIHHKCGALTGLVRVKHAQAEYATMPALLTEAEDLAQQYEYNDHLASLRLTQGPIAWDGHIPEWGSGFEVALGYYQQALIYALRYNRFLLDEVLWGGGVATPLRSLIPRCTERGAEGQQMLRALRDWWQTGRNDTGTPRPDTISPLPEGIPLLEAERLAREREPGNGTPQQPVVERLTAALRD